LRRHFGHQHWWPGESPFEVCVGAVLTQNTSWLNVERAIANLKRAGLMDPVRLYALPAAQLAELLRPAGYFNVKARRLRVFLAVLMEAHQARLASLFAGPTPEVRLRLLAINGIGPETADSMLLYAGGHLSFVVDAYTRRIFSRHGWCPADASYEKLQHMCVAILSHLPPARRLDYWQDYHAQLVMTGKDFCRAGEPHCAGCPLRDLLPKQ
jgi:endonuclease-3 related protein